MTAAATAQPTTVIVGAGLMGRWHARYAHRLGAAIVAVVDPDSERAAALAGDYRHARDYRDLSSCLQRHRGAVVHICTPLDSHLALATQAIDAGLHVIIEKPLATNPRQTAELLTLARSRKVSINVVHQFCWQQGVRKLSSDSPLGRLLRIEFITCTAGAELLPAQPSTQLIADILPHPLALFQQFLPGLTLASLDWQGDSASDGECVLNTVAGEVSLGIHISLNSRPTRCQLRLYGSDASATADLFHGYALIERGPVSRAQKLLQPAKLSAKLFGLSTLNLLRRLLAREPAYPGLKSLLRQVYQTPVPTALLSDAALVDIAAARDHIAARCGAGPAP